MRPLSSSVPTTAATSRCTRASSIEILGRLAPRPTLLYTVTEFQPNRADVNAALRGMLAYYPNAQIIDWATITAEEPSLLGADGYHLSPAGISRLVFETAKALGGAPTGAAAIA